jgi:hypothetical protein
LDISSKHLFLLDYEFKNEMEKQRIVKWESYIADELITKKEKEEKESTDYKIKKNMEK